MIVPWLFGASVRESHIAQYGTRLVFSKFTNFDKIEVTLVGLRKVWGV